MAGPSEEKPLMATIIDRARRGEIVPIVSNSYASDLAFRDYEKLIRHWADEKNYPHPGHDLAQMVQYETFSKAEHGHNIDELATKESYLEFLRRALFFIANEDTKVSASKVAELKAQGKRHVSELAWHLNYPSRRSEKANPLLLLAALPLPIYLTTSYHKFLEAALEEANKEPQTDFCRWHQGLYSIPSVFDQKPVYDPDKDRPLVYHLHGLDEYPKSLVLTEDDYLDFLINMSTTDEQFIHPRVTRALTDSTVVLLGYELRAWEFRALFRGIIKPRPQATPVKNVAIQLEGSLFERGYVKKYMQQARFEVEWTDAYTFIKQVFEGCEGA
jgi:hypothetical protein